MGLIEQIEGWQEIEIAVAMTTKRPWLWMNVFDNLHRQALKPKVVVIGIHGVYAPVQEEQLRDMMHRNMQSKVVFVHIDKSDTYGEALNKVQGIAAQHIHYGMICNMDDDDWYGPQFLAQIHAMYSCHPDATLIGKHGYWTRWIGLDRPPVLWEGPCEPDMTCSILCGGTIATSVQARREWVLRYDKTRTAGLDWSYIKSVSAAMGVRAKIYSTGTREYILQRYADPDHSHCWIDPR